MAEADLHDWTAAELRAAPRISLMLRAAKLVSPAGEFLCILRDVSATGLKARLFHALPRQGPFALELGTGERHPVEPVWERDRHAGFRFAHPPIDLTALVEEAGRFPKRQLRLAVDYPAILTIAQLDRPARLVNLSQHGALIELDEPLALCQPVQLRGGLLPLRHARVRWRKDRSHGLVFLEGFLLDELAELVGRLQNRSQSSLSGVPVNH
ncbi:MAG: hypothetical protein RL339_508 [Pseudomonadota bacterium]|jgi:hypothetical protein